MRRRTVAPRCESLEGRQLLAAGVSQAQLRRDFQTTVADLKQIQANSRVTRAQVQALENDIHAWNQSLGGKGALATPTARAALQDIQQTVELAFLDDPASDSTWQTTRSTILADLQAAGVNVPAGAVNQTITDLRAIAQSVGASPAPVSKYLTDTETVYNEAANRHLPSSLSPLNYYFKHLKGFIHG